MSGVS
jgi:hypothetical protein